jgi:hypothetical protein
MKVFVTMVDDTHTDPTAYVFTTPEAAVTYAKTVCREWARNAEDVEEEPIEGWLYYARYSPESSVWTLETELYQEGENPEP